MFESRARNAAGAMPPDSPWTADGFMQLFGDCQYAHATVDANRSQPYWLCWSGVGLAVP